MDKSVKKLLKLENGPPRTPFPTVQNENKKARCACLLVMPKFEVPHKVAAITAFIVCILFSASSKTIDCALSKTSSVTSIQVRPNFS